MAYERHHKVLTFWSLPQDTSDASSAIESCRQAACAGSLWPVWQHLSSTVTTVLLGRRRESESKVVHEATFEDGMEAEASNSKHAMLSEHYAQDCLN